MLLQKLTIKFTLFLSSKIKASTGVKLPFIPLAKICERYLVSLASRATASLGVRLKCCIEARIKSYNRELDLLISEFSWIVSRSMLSSLGGYVR